LQVWLDGLLSGAQAPAGPQTDHRRGYAMNGGWTETFAEETDDQPAERTEEIEFSLLKCRQRIRDRRELTGMPPLEIAEEERERRSAQIVESFLGDRAGANEPTPLHLILAARYIEGEMDHEQYGSAVRNV
jgi:hypothetical protein